MANRAIMIVSIVVMMEKGECKTSKQKDRCKYQYQFPVLLDR